jgi:MFS family permease
MFSILNHSGYRKYFIGTTVSSIGDGMHFVVIAWLLLQMVGNTSSMGLLLAIASLPGILFSPMTGVLVDRWDRKIICVAADVFRGFLLLFIPLLYSTGSLQVWHLYVLVFFVSIGELFHAPAAGGLIREIVPVTALLSANSLSSISYQSGSILGAGLAGLLITNLGTMPIITLNSLSFFFSAMSTFLVRSKYSAPQKNLAPRGTFRNFLDGAIYLRAQPHIMGIAALQVSLYIALNITNVLLPVFATQVLKVGAKGFGFIDAAWAAGAIFGGTWMLNTTKKQNQSRKFSLGMFLFAGSIMIFCLATNLYQAIAGYLLMGFFFISTRITFDTIIQADVTTEFQGRVKSTVLMVTAYISFITCLGAGYVGNELPLRFIYFGLALTILVGGFLSLPLARFLSLRNKKALD